MMAVLLLGACMALTLMFAVAGFTKLLDRPDTEKAVADFGVPPRFAKPMATAFPLADLASALLLLIGITAWWDSLAKLALLLTFAIGIAYNLWTGRRPECNCFGQMHSASISWSTLARNGVFS